MNVPFRKSDLARATAMAATLAIALGACTSESESANAGPDDAIGETATNDITGDEVAEAVPGIADADLDGTGPNSADYTEEGNAEFGGEMDRKPMPDDM